MLGDSLTANCLKFADDTKLFLPISNITHCQQLQFDIDDFVRQCDNLKLPLNMSKCIILTITKKKNPIIYNYTMHNVILSRKSSIRDLGVQIDSQLSFVEHIDNVIKHSNRSLGFLMRLCRNFNNVKILENLFSTLIRPKLEYCVLIWTPSTNKSKNALESCHKRFLKFLAYKTDGKYPPRGSDYPELCQRFNTNSLEQRRYLMYILFLFKLINGLIDAPELLSMLQLNVPQKEIRNNNMFFLSHKTPSLAINSPLYNLCNDFNKLSRDNQRQFDLFFVSISTLAKQVKLYIKDTQQ